MYKLIGKKLHCVVIGLICCILNVALWIMPLLFKHNLLPSFRLDIFHPNSAVPSSPFQHLHLEENKEDLLLLYWSYPWGIKSYVPAEGSKIGTCTVTSNRNLLEKADAVIFHYTTITKSDLPWKHYRDASQRFIWWSAEGPALFKKERSNLREFDGGFFNWTWTYRKDADVKRLYGYREKVITSVSLGNRAIDDIIKSKTKLAIWFVSQCDYTNGAKLRWKYAMDLKAAGLEFSGYGKCFNNDGTFPTSSKKLMDKAIKEHKFYFAFENAYHCTDYITEKFWANAVLNDAVPIVLGPKKEDILSVAPLDSFVFAEDFESPHKLAEYIKFLDSHTEDYRKFVRWREDPNMTDEKMITMILKKYPQINVMKKPKSICDELLETKETKIIESLTHEFIDKNPKECLQDL